MMSWVDDLAGAAGRGAEAVRLGVRTLTPLDTNRVPAEWDHVTKVDPEEGKALPLLFPLYLQHTSAVSVGGSRDVTAENTEETFDLLDAVPVPVFHEPSGARQVTEHTYEQCDFLAVPEVLNGDAGALVGTLGEGTAYVREELGPRMLREKLGWLPLRMRDRLVEFATSWLLAEAVFEAYVIQNPDSAAAREANVDPDDVLDPREAAKRALAAERHLESEVLYVEYSGTFGGGEAADVLGAIDEVTTWSRVWYGGGLDSRERARRVLDAGADAVVVGNAFHEIAEEERELCARAAGELSADAPRREVREWVTDGLDPAGTSAARYLETIPGVVDPAGTAARYLTETVHTRLGLEGVAADLDGSDAGALRRAVDGRDGLPGTDALGGVIGEAAPELARTYALAYLGARFGADVGGPSTVRLGGLE